MLRLLPLAALALLFPPAPAAAESTLCTAINSLPAVITAPGHYCLQKDLTTSIGSGAAIQIEADDVTIDCNGHRLSGLGAGPSTQATGILAGARSFITVRDCNVRGFQMGVYIGGYLVFPQPVGNIVEDSRFDGNTRRGISVNGRGGVIRRNVVTDTGENPDSLPVTAIFADGGTDVIDNLVENVALSVGTATATGIYTSNAEGIVVERNRVRGVASTGPERGFVTFGGQMLLRGNVFTTTTPAHHGLRCGDGETVTIGNTSLNFDIPYEDCVDGGGNVAVAAP